MLGFGGLHQVWLGTPSPRGPSCTHKVNSSSQVRSVVSGGRALDSFCTGSFSWSVHSRFRLPAMEQRAPLGFYWGFLIP